jgi:osmotically-inducible protein OsmY
VVLVTGEAVTEEARQQVIEIVRAIPRVRQVYDELAVAPPTSLLARSSDSVITAKVKTQLVAIKDFDATRVKVVTERGVVYLLGLLSAADAERVTEVTRAVGGVQKVVKLFEYVE